MAVSDQLPRYTDAILDRDRTNMLQGLLYGTPLDVAVDDTNALAVTVTSTTVDGAGATTAHDWYKYGLFRIIAGGTAPTAAITITVTQAAGGGTAEPVGGREIENTLAFPVTIIGASQDANIDPPVIPANSTRRIFIGAVSIFPAEREKMVTYTVATVPTDPWVGAGAGPIFVSDGAAGSPVMAFHDGTNWLRCDTLAAISAT